MNLPGPVIYALKVVSAGFVAAAADGPLPFGDAVLVTASVALVATLAIYWSSVAPKWPQIVRVFERQFSDSISTVRRVLAKVKGDTTSKVKEKEKKEIQDAKKKIPTRLKRKKGNVDLGKFDRKVKNKTEYKEKGGWSISKDRDGHRGSEWKLKDTKGKRVASLDKNGYVVGK